MMCWRLSLLLLCALAAHGRLADLEELRRESDAALAQELRNKLYHILRLQLKKDETSPAKTTITKETTSVRTESPEVKERNSEKRKVLEYPKLSRPSFRPSSGSSGLLPMPDSSPLRYQPHSADGRPPSNVLEYPKLSRPSFKPSSGSADLLPMPDSSSLVDRRHSADGRPPSNVLQYPKLSRPSFGSSSGSAGLLPMPDSSSLRYQSLFTDGSLSNILQRRDEQTGVFHGLWDKGNNQPRESNFKVPSPVIHPWKPKPQILSQTHSRNSSPWKSALSSRVFRGFGRG